MSNEQEEVIEEEKPVETASKKEKTPIQPYKVLPKSAINVLYCFSEPKKTSKRLRIIGRGRKVQPLENAITVVAEKSTRGNQWGKLEDGTWVNLSECFIAS